MPGNLKISAALALQQWLITIEPGESYVWIDNLFSRKCLH